MIYSNTNDTDNMMKDPTYKKMLACITNKFLDTKYEKQTIMNYLIEQHYNEFPFILFNFFEKSKEENNQQIFIKAGKVFCRLVNYKTAITDENLEKIGMRVLNKIAHHALNETKSYQQIAA